MCFSAEASFIAAAVLIGTSVYTIKKTLSSKDLSFMLLALIPLLFGIQQLSEGFVWLFLGKNANLDQLLSYIFLFFAFFLWPVWVPLSLGVFDHPRKKFFYVAAFLGLIYGCILYGSPFFYHTSFHLQVCEHSICYKIHHPLFNKWGVSFYFLFTIVPFLVAKSLRIKILGILIGASAIITAFFYIQAFTSVWCFFSASISIYVGYMAYKLKNITQDTL
ncbi:MAG: hypothetical protein SP1CHLAM9_03310 [Chlamydiia bacterium]|nr:hypothetical protein [Chlamydiia bacterium]MCH9624103.1 hypothetical protein [Chlamydiia bacterium]